MTKFFIFLSLATLLLVTSCTKTPVASFTSDKTTVEAGQAVKFTNTSKNGVTSKWDFGDGSSSTDESPSHTFTKAGSYSVKLTSYSKKEKKMNSSSSKVTVNDVRDKFVGSFSGSETLTIAGSTSTSQNATIISKSSNFADRIIFDGDFSYATVSGNNFSIPSQSQNDVDSNGNPIVINVTSGSGVLNGTTLSFTYSGTFQNISGTYPYTVSSTLIKQ